MRLLVFIGPVSGRQRGGGKVHEPIEHVGLYVNRFLEVFWDLIPPVILSNLVQILAPLLRLAVAGLSAKRVESAWPLYPAGASKGINSSAEYCQ
jgi:hypothetical protein